MSLPAPLQVHASFSSFTEALKSGTHLAVVAHPDDIEILAGHAISQCYQNQNQHLVGVVVTDGAGAPHGPDAPSNLAAQRLAEQKQAAELGEYATTLTLNYKSQDIKPGPCPELLSQLLTLLQTCQPQAIYTHSLFDRHSTHQAVALHLVKILRQLRFSGQVYGVEVWGSLEWLPELHRVALPIERPQLIKKLIACHRSQTQGKNYEDATLARMQANATFWQADQLDKTRHLLWAQDLSGLVNESPLHLSKYLEQIYDRSRMDLSQEMFAWMS